MNRRNNFLVIRIVLEIKNWSVLVEDEKGEEKKLLDKVDLTVGKKEIHCLLGKNGSGKTTLAYAIMGLARGKKESGEIFFQGKKINQLRVDRRAKLGITMAFQEPARFEGLTVDGFLSVGNKKITNKEKESALFLAGLGKEFLLRKLDDKLSGGERKRIELASVLIMKPKLIILDEPDASLDIIVYNELYNLILSFREKLNCSILLITHREEAGLIADKATLLEKGKVVKTGAFRLVMRTYCQQEGRKERCCLRQ